MKNKVAILVYPHFSMQEIGNLCGLFKWNCDSQIEVLSSSLESVSSEEGIQIKPTITFEQFEVDKFDCLILPGCSDMRQGLCDTRIKLFLETFKGNEDFLIGAICGAPAFLAQAGLLKGKKFTNSLFVEMNEMLEFIDEENIEYKPLVEDGNIITAVGFAFNDFAITLARRIGYECPDKIYTGVPREWKEADYKIHMNTEGINFVKKEFKEFIG